MGLFDIMKKHTERNKKILEETDVFKGKGLPEEPAPKKRKKKDESKDAKQDI